MAKRRNAKAVARLLRKADQDLKRGLTIADVSRKLGVAQPTYFRWRKSQSAAGADPARDCRELAAENERLKQTVADLVLDNRMLRDLAKKKW